MSLGRSSPEWRQERNERVWREQKFAEEKPLVIAAALGLLALAAEGREMPWVSYGFLATGAIYILSLVFKRRH